MMDSITEESRLSTPIQYYEQHARFLVDPQLSIQTRLEMIMEVRDRLEIVYTDEYLNFLKCYFNAFFVILTELTKPQFTDNSENQIRNIILEVFNSLPTSEVLRPFALDLLKLALNVLVVDNERNGLICIKIILNVVRKFKIGSGNEIRQMVDFVSEVYKNFEATVRYFFEDGGGRVGSDSGSGTSVASGDGKLVVENKKVMEMSGLVSSAYSGNGQLNPSTRSFLIAIESPLVVMALFHLCPPVARSSVPHLLPLIIGVMSVPGPSKVPPQWTKHLGDMKVAQIKAVSFLTYLLRSFSDNIRPHEETICRSIVNLLVTCPDSATIQKDLLVAMKHFLRSEFKRGLFPFIDTLLGESFLAGTGRRCFQICRPLAYNQLAQIIHLVRADLSLSQLSQIIYLSSSNMHDESLHLSSHTTSACLMLNLVEPIFQKGVDQPTMDEARCLMGKILDAFMGKFSTFKRIIPQILEGGNEGREWLTLRSKLETPEQAVLNLQAPFDYSKEVGYCKNLIKTLVMGTRTIMWSITHAHLPREQVSSSLHGTQQEMQVSSSLSMSITQGFKGMTVDEVLKSSEVLRSGIHCLSIFKEKYEENEMLHLFSEILAVLEPRDFMDILSLCLPELFECMISNDHLVYIISGLLHEPKLFSPCADVLLNFVVSNKLGILKNPDAPAAKLVLYLIRWIFEAIAKGPPNGEHILQLHVPVIMEACIKYATEVDHPVGYMQLLRIIFRAVYGEKFQLLLRDLIPMLHPCLNMLLSMIEGPTSEYTRDLALGLCLTLPAQLSSLLPHFPCLMKPLVLTLKGSDDLVKLGLATLDTWIDYLNPDFLESNMANVMADVILALWSHLKPSPYPWGRKSLQILGKLGGLNRRFLKEPLALECKDNPEHGFRLTLTFQPETAFLVPLDRCISFAVAAVLRNNSNLDIFYRKKALRFLCLCLSSQLNLQANATKDGSSFGTLMALLSSSVDPILLVAEDSDVKVDLGVKTKTQLIAEKSVCKIVLMTIISASAEPELKGSTDDFVVNICRHFAMIYHVNYSSTNSLVGSDQPDHMLPLSSTVTSSSRSPSSSNMKKLNPLIFLDALVDVLSDQNRLHAKAALNALNMFSEILLGLAHTTYTDMHTSNGDPAPPTMVSSPSTNPLYSPPPSVCVPVFEQLLLRLLHCCYGSTWETQMGGVIGLGALVGKLTVKTLCTFQLRVIRGLFYVLKRLPLHAKKEQDETSQVLTQVLRLVNNADEGSSETTSNFQGVLNILAAELFTPNPSLIVRKNAQTCLNLLAKRTACEVSELLEPLCQRLLKPLIMRPLRFKNVGQQVGTVTTLNFCLALRPPVLKWTQELTNFLHDALQIAEADETVWIVKFMNPKVAASLNKLRTGCIELLCTAMTCSDFMAPDHAELRSKIITLILKSLTCRTPEIVAISKQGLRQAKRRMSKDILQKSLKPILANLAHTKCLTVPLLQGLAHVLDLGSNWFTVSFGGKLLEHLKKWLEPEKLDQCRKLWKAGDEPKVAAAIIELFHLLPRGTDRFLDELVTVTMDLEGTLPQGQFHSEINSPYRLPLTKFLNRYASDAIDYFLSRINQRRYFRRFMFIIHSEVAQPLREELAKSPEKILAIAFPQVFTKLEASRTATSVIPAAPMSNEIHDTPLTDSLTDSAITPTASSDAYFQGLALIVTLVKLMPEWLPRNRVVFDTLVLIWRSPARIARLNNEQELSLAQVNESKWLVKCFLNYVRHDNLEVNVLFDMLSIFLFRTRIDYTFLREFYIIEVAEGYTPSMKKRLLSRFLHIFQSKELGQNHLVVTMQMLIRPMMAHAFQNSESREVVDPVILQMIAEKLLDPPENVSAEYGELLRIELLQLSTLLIKYLHNDLVDHRLSFFKFGWDSLKREGSASRQWALVNVSQLFEAYKSPEKVVFQVLDILLKESQSEDTMLIKQAIDILLPALPKRLAGGPGIPKWIHFIKKALVEGGYSVPVLVHIFQLIVHHPDLFYVARAQFVPKMVNLLCPLGLPPNSTVENKRLAIEIAGLVVGWERQRQKEMKVVLDTNGASQRSNVLNRGSISGVTKRSSDGSTLPDDLSKLVEVEPCLQSIPIVSHGSAQAVCEVDTPGSGGQPGQDFKPSAAMEEMIIYFLMRVSLVIDPKDKGVTSLYIQALKHLSEALEVWPNANVKFDYLEKLLDGLQPSQSNKDIATAFARGMDVMNTIMEKQPQIFIRNNINQISQILEPCFSGEVLDEGKYLCVSLKMVFGAFPPESANTPQDVKILYQKVMKLIQNHLDAAISSQTPLESANSMITFVLSVVKTLVELQTNSIDPFLTSLTRVLQRLAHDTGSEAASHATLGPRRDPDSAVSSSHAVTDVGSVMYNLKSILKLINKRTMFSPDSKRFLNETLHTLLSQKGVDSSVLLCILDVVKGWNEDDFSRPSTSSRPRSVLNQKEIVTYLHKLSQVDKQNFSVSALEEWDRKYLELLYGVCADSKRFPLSVRQEVFQKVERRFMRGLSAKDPETRQKFILLYHESLEKTLFARLDFILQLQDWEELGDIFWLKQGLDLLFKILIENRPIELAPNSARVPPLVPLGYHQEHSGLHQQITDTPEDSEGVQTLKRLVLNHSQFLNEMSKLQVADLINPLTELAHVDANVAYHLWVLIFPIAWATLLNQEQLALAKSMINLLSKDYHKRQQASRPNVVQALLEGLRLSHPQPRIPSELIKYIGKTFNAWHTSLPMLESHVILLTKETKCCESLSELYRLLNEEDMRCGLWKKRSITSETTAGLSLVQHGYWQRAQSLFYQAMIKATQGTYDNTVPKAEMCLWEEQWLYSAAQLSQWDALVDFGSSVENYAILLDSFWKTSNWKSVMDDISKAHVAETPNLRLVQAFLALHAKNADGIRDVGNIVLKSVDLALEQWWQLPELSVQSQIPLLEQFQQLIEINDSFKIKVAIANGSKQISGSSAVEVSNGAYGDLKEILKTWRLRTPNKWDNLSVWYDLLQWRNEMYTYVINALKDFETTNQQLHLLGYRDKAWNVNKLAHIARKQGLYDVCLTVLEKMYGHSTIEVQEAFVKIKEQAKACLELRGELISGLNLIASTNLDFFPVKHKAEIFRIKGDFFSKLGDSEKANLAYSDAITLFKQFPKGWISWGNYCDKVYKETQDEAWLEYAVSCFLQGIKYGVSNSRNHLARVLYLLSFDTANEPAGRAFDKYLDQIPHWIWLSWVPQLLNSLQRPEARHCKLVLLKLATVYPQALYYWLRMYFVELRDFSNKFELGKSSAMTQAQQRMQQTAVGAGNGPLGSAVRNTRVQNHPGSGLNSENHQCSQPCGVRGSHDCGTSNCQKLERPTREEASAHVRPGQMLSRSSSSINGGGQRTSGCNDGLGTVASEASALYAAKDILDALRSKHTVLASELEGFLGELGSRFLPRAEEVFLVVINAVILHCYKHSVATTAEVPQSLKNELSSVFKSSFPVNDGGKYTDCVRQYKQAFKRDFDPTNASTFPATLSELTGRLKRWKNVIEGNIDDRFPSVLKLEEESRLLLNSHFIDLEIPGQYFTDQEVAPAHTVKLDKIGSDITIVRRHGASYRRLTLIGSDGSRHHFIVQTTLSSSARSDERVIDLFRVMNRMFDKHKESRRRHLGIHTPLIIPVSQQVRLVEDDPMHITFLEVYEVNSARNNREADLPIIHFKEQLDHVISGLVSPEVVSDFRLQTYTDITKNLVNETVFTQYMHKTLMSNNLLWAFKKQFSVHIALSCFMSFILKIGGRSPDKILFAKNTGKVFQTDFRPAYDENGMIKFNEPVPFRLTSNMESFFSPFGVEGLIVSSISAAAQAVVSPKQIDHSWHQLAMFFRDELISWSHKRSQGMHSSAVASGGSLNSTDLKHKITTNVKNVMNRIKGIAPHYSAEEDDNGSEPPQSVERGASELVEAALNPRNLCMMDPTWHPWF